MKGFESHLNFVASSTRPDYRLQYRPCVQELLHSWICAVYELETCYVHPTMSET